MDSNFVVMWVWCIGGKLMQAFMEWPLCFHKIQVWIQHSMRAFFLFSLQLQKFHKFF